MGFSPSRGSVTQSLRAASRYYSPSLYLCPSCSIRYFRSSRRSNSRAGPDPRLEAFGKVIRDEYSVVRDYYGSSQKLWLWPLGISYSSMPTETPKHPIILAHGLLGFDELRLAGPFLPGVQYWRGIKEALSMKGVEVITATVPPSASIEMRAEVLAETITSAARGREVNIVA